MIKDILKLEELLPLLINLDKDKIYDVSIKEYKVKRSLNANSYLWLLINKLATAMRMSKDKVYDIMLERYGISELVIVSPMVEVEKFFNHCVVVREDNYKKYVKVMQGSSTYDTKEMSVLIDGVVSECEELGIETMTPAELERLKNEWQ